MWLLLLAIALAGCRSPAPEPGDGLEPAPNRAAEERLRAHVRMLAEQIGPRCGATNETYVKLERAADYIRTNFEIQLRGVTDRSLVAQSYEDGGRRYTNIELEIAGASSAEIVVVGAHYDSDCSGGGPHTPGADDNASGVAVLLELAHRIGERQRATPAEFARRLRFVAFANEEAPYFQTAGMGSLVYAQQCQKKDEAVSAMLSLETIGYYRSEPGSQRYPFGLDRVFSLPDRGDFLAFVGNLASRQLMLDAVAAFRRASALPAEGLAAPAFSKLTWSDQWAFWEMGYPALMVTDTAIERNPNYHAPSDTWETLDYGRLAQAVDGLEAVVVQLSAAP